MIYELDEALLVDTPLGRGYAILVDFCRNDHWWTVILDSGAIITFRQEQIKAARNYSYNRNMTDKEMEGILNGTSRQSQSNEADDKDEEGRAEADH